MRPSATVGDETVILFSAQHQGASRDGALTLQLFLYSSPPAGPECEYQCVCITSHAQYASEVPTCRPEPDATCNHIKVILSPGPWSRRVRPCSRPKLLPSGIIKLPTFPSYAHFPASSHRLLTVKTAHYTDCKKHIFAVLCMNGGVCLWLMWNKDSVFFCSKRQLIRWGIELP